eukprot:scaffold2951_cov99-Isochrysis_galbana.AAC.1
MCWVRLRFPEGLRSARSMAAAIRLSRCAGWQAGCSRLQLRIALATEAAGLRALARRGCKAPEAIRMLLSSKLRCAGPMGRCEVVRGHARQRVRHR